MADFACELTQSLTCDSEAPSACRRSGVDFAAASKPSVGILARREIAALLHGLKHWIKSARTDAIAVPCQFLDQPLPVKLAFCGVVQNVNAHEPGQQVV